VVLQTAQIVRASVSQAAQEFHILALEEGQYAVIQ
jgi:hypothetical protein